jgi:hypothetical protein
LLRVRGTEVALLRLEQGLLKFIFPGSAQNRRVDSRFERHCRGRPHCHHQEGRVLGVLQICRKGLDPSLAGADFTLDDLPVLEAVAKIAAQTPFLRS